MLDKLLSLLKDGAFDGGFSERESKGTRTILYIEDGIPKRRYEGKSTRFFNGKENEKIKGKIEEVEYKTDEEKIDFIQKYGFIGEIFGYDENARAESKKYYQERDKKK